MCGHSRLPRGGGLTATIRTGWSLRCRRCHSSASRERFCPRYLSVTASQDSCSCPSSFTAVLQFSPGACLLLSNYVNEDHHIAVVSSHRAQDVICKPQETEGCGNRLILRKHIVLLLSTSIYKDGLEGPWHQVFHNRHCVCVCVKINDKIHNCFSVTEFITTGLPSFPLPKLVKHCYLIKMH